MSIPYWAILIFLVINVSILYTVRNKQSVSHFFIGNRQMSWLAIAVSIAATSFGQIVCFL